MYAAVNWLTGFEEIKRNTIRYEHTIHLIMVFLRISRWEQNWFKENHLLLHLNRSRATKNISNQVAFIAKSIFIDRKVFRAHIWRFQISNSSRTSIFTRVLSLEKLSMTKIFMIQISSTHETNGKRMKISLTSCET